MENKEKISKLPKNWVLTTLGEIGIVVSGGTPSSRQPEFWGGDIAWITPADLSNYKNKYIERGQRNISKIGLDNSSTKLLPKGTVMFSSRAPIGYTVIAKNEIATNQGFKNLILTKSGHPDFIYYYLQASKQLAESYASGTTFLELSATKFSQIPIPLPPFSEQHRIVEKIEELYSELDKAQENLLNAQKQVEIYRQVVLKNAFEGKLLDIEGISTTLDNCILSISQMIKPEENPEMTYLGLDSFTQNGLNPIKQYKLKETKSSAKYFEKGDVLYARMRPYLNKVYLAEFNGACSGEFIVLRCRKNIINSFLTYLLHSQRFVNYANNEATGDRPRVRFSSIKKFHFKLFELDNQVNIVQEIENRFTIIGNLENSINENLKRIEIFKQIILQKAFSGNLVLQDEMDEPANKLVNRIKQEKKSYQIQQKEIKKNLPLKLVFMESNKTVKELLEEATEPIEAKEIWQKSVHKDDIERFYEELKKISADIEEIREGKISKIFLKK